MKRIAILGSTGSVGRNALEIISNHRDQCKVVALTAGKNIGLMEEQIQSFSPEVVAVADEAAARDLRSRMQKHATSILSGHDGVTEVAGYRGSEFVLSAIVGAAGLIPTISAIQAGKTIGLANKEALVMAGGVVTDGAKKNGGRVFFVCKA